MPSREDPAAAFRAAAQALNEAGDAQVRKQVYAAFRRATGPLGADVIREGAADMPKHGGLAGIIAAAKMSQSNSTTGRNPGITLRFNTRPKHDLKALDDGVLRHPVFPRPGRKRTWRTQRVAAGAFTRPFDAGVGPVRDQAIDALEDIAATIAHRTGTASKGI